VRATSGVLIVGHGADEHADAVEHQLQRRHVPTLRLSREHLPNSAFAWTPTGTQRIGDYQVASGPWSGLWRRPGWPQVRTFARAFQDFAHDESVDAFDGWVRGLNVHWLTSPEDLRRSELKLVQLRIAAGLDISIPETLITNDPRAAIDFVHRRPEVVAKPVRYGLLRTDRPKVAFTSIVSREMLTHLDGPPVILQERLPAQAHLRVITIRRDVFAAMLKTPLLDWRADLGNHDRFEIAPDVMRDEVAGQAIALADALRLGFSAQDWVFTEDRGPVFLEANPNGQWLFVDCLWDGAIVSGIAGALERDWRAMC
jgi:glutathione synthase/RimK-type ligase-like ATP-grasp enzyme